VWKEEIERVVWDAEVRPFYNGTRRWGVGRQGGFTRQVRAEGGVPPRLAGGDPAGNGPKPGQWSNLFKFEFQLI
jgi:hypothetical protein